MSATSGVLPGVLVTPELYRREGGFRPARPDARQVRVDHARKRKSRPFRGFSRLRGAGVTPSFLLGLLPPAELAARIETWRERLGLRESAPHVTVKARSGLDPEGGWVPLAQSVVALSSPIRLEVGGARAFRNGSAVYLAVRSPDAVALHVRLLDALKPAQRFGYEGPHMTPHLTLALKRRGVDLGAVLEEARAEFADLEAQPLVFTCREVWVMRKPGPGGLYVPEEAWPLGDHD